MNPLDTLTKEQREAVRGLIERGFDWGFHGVDCPPSKQAALEIFPDPEPVMVPLDDVLPLLEAIKAGESWFIFKEQDKFREKHADKLK